MSGKQMLSRPPVMGIMKPGMEMRAKPVPPRPAPIGKVACGKCGGAGNLGQEMGIETCPTCAGTGRDNKSDCWSEPCRGRCNGTGKVTYCRAKICPICRGAGFVRG
jgi:hypothetical protein